MIQLKTLILSLAALGSILAGSATSCHGQISSQEELDPSTCKLLMSPYAAERKLGVKALLALAEKHWENESFLSGWLNHDSELLRMGAAQVAAKDPSAVRAVKKIMAVIKKDKVKSRRQELALIAFGAAFEGWTGESDFFDGNEGVDGFSMAAMQFVRSKLSNLAAAGTQTTDHAALGKLASLGPYAAPALKKILSDSGEGLYQRALALSAMARVNSKQFWVKEDGSLSGEVRRILDDGDEYLKVNVLFSMAYFGFFQGKSVEALKNYTLQDAYSAETIQGGLYFLYTLPNARVKEEEKHLAAVAKEYLDGSYAQKVRFHAGVLLARINVAPLAKQAVVMIKETPDFASYWAMGALLNRAADLPEAERAPLIDDLIQWVLESKNCAPQLKGTALWHLKQMGKPFPQGVTIEKVIASIHKTMEKVHMASEDPNYLAIRSGLDILAYLKDPKVDALIRKNLKHESEAVRMAAGIAGGNTGHKELIPDLIEATKDQHEFSAYGAAWGLSKLDDKLALAWFARYLLSGNAPLMRSSLDVLRAQTKKKMAESTPTDPQSWRERGRAWCLEIKKNATQ